MKHSLTFADMVLSCLLGIFLAGAVMVIICLATT
jgi:hypothetical protein